MPRKIEAVPVWVALVIQRVTTFYCSRLVGGHSKGVRLASSATSGSRGFLKNPLVVVVSKTRIASQDSGLVFHVLPSRFFHLHKDQQSFLEESLDLSLKRLGQAVSWALLLRRRSVIQAYPAVISRRAATTWHSKSPNAARPALLI